MIGESLTYFEHQPAKPRSQLIGEPMVDGVWNELSPDPGGGFSLYASYFPVE
jgi:hypothetical protein